MIIMVILVLLVPALICLKCYEKFRGKEHSWVVRAQQFAIFAFLLNLIGYAVFWLRGWDKIGFSLGGDTSMFLTSFVVQYMAITLVAAVVLAYVLSLVRITAVGRKTLEDTAGEMAEGDVEDAEGDCGPNPQ